MELCLEVYVQILCDRQSHSKIPLTGSKGGYRHPMQCILHAFQELFALRLLNTGVKMLAWDSAVMFVGYFFFLGGEVGLRGKRLDWKFLAKQSL